MRSFSLARRLVMFETCLREEQLVKETDMTSAWSQPASCLLDGPLQILDGHLKKTSFGRMFIILTAFGLLINFMMASQNLSLLQYSWRPQLAKQLLYKIYPLPFNVSYFLDNRYRQCQCFQYTHSTRTVLIGQHLTLLENV